MGSEMCIRDRYEETGFYDFMGALEGGDEAQANLKLLYERARKYEESGFKGIFNFIRYIERIEKRNEDLSGAQLINENHNVCLLYTSPSPRDGLLSRMPSSA